MGRILVVPADKEGCGNYRLIWPARAMQAAGHDDVVLRDELPSLPQMVWAKPFIRTPLEDNEIIDIEDWPADVDTVVIQRPVDHQWLSFIELMHQFRVRVVIDLDDNLDRIPQGNMAWYASQEHWVSKFEYQQMVLTWGKDVKASKQVHDNEYLYVPDYKGVANSENLKRALHRASAAVFSTGHLSDFYARHVKERHVMENRLPDRFLRYRDWIDEADEKYFGWTGNIYTHPHDPRVLKNVPADLLATRPDWRMLLVGKALHHSASVMPEITDAFGKIPRLDSPGMVPFHEYHHHYAQMQVAMCPLSEDIFNRSKSWLKPLEAAFLGVVPVMSPLPEYQKLNEMGIGLMASSKSQWENRVGSLLDHETYREELREMGYKVAETLTLEQHAHNWYRAWRGA